MKKIIFFIAFLIPVLGFSQDLNNGLVAKFLFNGNLADSSVNQNNLLANGVALYTIDHLGKSNNALSIMDMNGFICTLKMLTVHIISPISIQLVFG